MALSASMVTKLANLNDRFEEVSALLSDPEIMAERDKFTNLSKEFAELEPVVLCYRNVQKLEDQIADSTAPFQHSSLAAKLMANTAHGQHSSLSAQLPFSTAHGQHSQLAASQVTASTARSQGSLRPAHLTTHGRVRGHSPTDRHLALRRIDHGFEFLVVPSGDPLAPFS